MKFSTLTINLNNNNNTQKLNTASIENKDEINQIISPGY